MKGARHYRKSKRMKVKAARDNARKHKRAAHASILRPSAAPEPNAAAAVAQQGGASVCVDHAAKRRVRFAHDTVEHSRLPKDDFLVMVIDGVDFLWATPTAHKSDPESLLESFPILQNLQLLALEGPRPSLGDAVNSDCVDVVVPAEETGAPA
mmetsp:Transcript_17914/g.36039  ORF Transcript_17914/g.36039 Transcript_17914/m.36039 type:complete len:153 (+) Transcript_17914:239-697(+)